MKKLIFFSLAFIVLSSHDMFLKMDTYFLSPNSSVTLHLFNGTFDKSENVISRDRMIDVSIVGNGFRNRINTSAWTELDSTITVLHFETGDAGTYVAGVSTKARNIELTAVEFNDYLEHDGVLDMIESRKENGTIDQPAVEKYSKHVKAIFQVGEVMSSDWKTPLGYSIEFIPQNNPYELSIGDEIEFQLLREGQPLSNQLVYSGFTGAGHTHEANDDDDDDDDAHHHEENKMRTDENGKGKFKVDHGGQWYLRTIHMVTSKDPGLTHESNWATLTFEVTGSGHGQQGMLSLVYLGVGLLFLIALFIYLRKGTI